MHSEVRDELKQLEKWDTGQKDALVDVLVGDQVKHC